MLICQAKIPPEGRKTEISTGPDGKPYNIFQLADKVLSVEPWPFDVATFDICFESRSIHRLAFQDSSELRTAFTDASIDEIHWTVRKMPKEYKKRAKA